MMSVGRMSAFVSYVSSIHSGISGNAGVRLGANISCYMSLNISSPELTARTLKG